MSDYPEPAWINDDCPGGLPWTACHADDCGVTDRGDGCHLAGPHPAAPPTTQSAREG